jgi:hypothetical protein
MKGLQFWGLVEAFLMMPSAVGLLVNNIAIVNVSSDFLVLRHLRNIKIDRSFDDSELQHFNVEARAQPGDRLLLLGSPIVFGQCILPNDLFYESNLDPLESCTRYNGISESAVFRLDHKLQAAETGLGPVSTYRGNKDTHIALMELNLSYSIKYLLKDFLQSNFSQISKSGHAAGIRHVCEQFILTEDVQIAKLKNLYARLSGATLLV